MLGAIASVVCLLAPLPETGALTIRSAGLEAKHAGSAPPFQVTSEKGPRDTQGEEDRLGSTSPGARNLTGHPGEGVAAGYHHPWDPGSP